MMVALLAVMLARLFPLPRCVFLQISGRMADRLRFSVALCAWWYKVYPLRCDYKVNVYSSAMHQV